MVETVQFLVSSRQHIRDWSQGTIIVDIIIHQVDKHVSGATGLLHGKWKHGARKHMRWVEDRMKRARRDIKSAEISNVEGPKGGTLKVTTGVLVRMRMVYRCDMSPMISSRPSPGLC